MLEQTEADLVRKLREGDQQTLALVFSQFRERLRRIVAFRLDYRLAGRISHSDVLQEAYIAAAKRLDNFATQENMSAFLWLRLVVGQQLTDVHRQHLQAGKRDVRKEVALQPKGLSPHTSVAIANCLLDKRTAVSEVLARAEQLEKLECTLNQMDEVDREVIALRHFEELSNIEAARVIGIEPAAASKRYIRAMTRLSDLMAQHRW
ncbi:MAG: sigma-70 family RNA polymerase sigma factor [Planctomycetales bacterium]|nr:sigma-70 family RNA polymerase sigma factor [Planctomycetales bacterium]